MIIDLQDRIQELIQENRELKRQVKELEEKWSVQECILWQLEETKPNCWDLQFHTDNNQLNKLEDVLGLRILMTDQHQWSSEDIIRAFHGQATIENVFRKIKNPYHLAVRPQLHWTDQ